MGTSLTHTRKEYEVNRYPKGLGSSVSKHPPACIQMLGLKTALHPVNVPSIKKGLRCSEYKRRQARA